MNVFRESQKKKMKGEYDSNTFANGHHHPEGETEMGYIYKLQGKFDKPQIQTRAGLMLLG